MLLNVPLYLRLSCSYPVTIYVYNSISFNACNAATVCVLWVGALHTSKSPSIQTEFRCVTHTPHFSMSPTIFLLIDGHDFKFTSVFDHLLNLAECKQTYVKRETAHTANVKINSRKSICEIQFWSLCLPNYSLSLLVFCRTVARTCYSVGYLCCNIWIYSRYAEDTTSRRRIRSKSGSRLSA